MRHIRILLPVLLMWLLLPQSFQYIVHAQDDSADDVEFGAVILDNGSKFYGLINRLDDTVEVVHRSGTIYAFPAKRIKVFKTKKMSLADYEAEVHTYKNSYLEYKIRRPDSSWVIADRPVSPLNDTKIYHKILDLEVGVYIQPVGSPRVPLTKDLLKPMGDQILIDLLEFYQSAKLEKSKFDTFKGRPCLKFWCDLQGWDKDDKSKSVLYLFEHSGMLYRLQAHYLHGESLMNIRKLYAIFDTFTFIEQETPGEDVYLDDIYHFRVQNVFDWKQKLDRRDDRHIVSFSKDSGTSALEITAYYTDVKPDVEAMTNQYFQDKESAGATLFEPTRGMLNYGTVGFQRAVKTEDNGVETVHFVSHFWTNQVCYRLYRKCLNLKEELQELDLLEREVTIVQDLRSEDVVIRRIRAINFFVTGHKLMAEEGDLDGAKAAFSQALELYPSYAGALAYMCICELDRSVPVALSYLKKTTDLLGDLPTIRNFSRGVYLQVASREAEAGDYREAIKRLKQGKQYFDGKHENVFKESMAMLYMNIAVTKYNKERWSDCIDNLIKGLKYQSQSKELNSLLEKSYYNWAVRESNKGDNKDALKVCNRGLKKLPSSSLLRGLKQQLTK